MPFEEYWGIRGKIRAIDFALPDDMEYESSVLGDLADHADELDEGDLVQRIRPVLQEIRRRAGRRGESVPGFPLARDAHGAISDLESTLHGAGYP